MATCEDRSASGGGGGTKLLQHSGVQQFSGVLFSAKSETRQTKLRGTQAEVQNRQNLKNQGNEGGRSKQEESLRQEMLDHRSQYKRPDKLATGATGRGTKGTQVRHIT